MTLALAHPPTQVTTQELGAVLRGIDAWLETMRAPEGYGGPVPHWWNHCLYYTGAGLDWRYEGIVQGYLTLYEGSRAAHWLGRARRAGDDLARGQLPDGRFRNSNFEYNPRPGGTPHEAACDVALARLARTLRREQRDGWQQYARVATRNIEGYILGVLWKPAERRFWNEPFDPTFVPNKAATIVEALCAWAALVGDDGALDRYVLPTLDAILACQVRAAGRLDGAIHQGMRRGRGTQQFFPFYIARCVPALLLGYLHSGHERYLLGAQRAMAFVLREQLPDGSFPQVVYGNGRANRTPQWVAGVGDILRAIDALREYGIVFDGAPALRWLLQGALPGGGLRTARGFAATKLKRAAAPDFRDLLPACGWVDKAFRYLATLAPHTAPAAAPITPYALPCTYGGRAAQFYEDAHAIAVRTHDRLLYTWRKGEPLLHQSAELGEVL